MAKVHVSLHDVMPETFNRVEAILSDLQKKGLPPITLLVVPGREWSTEQLQKIRDWAHNGHPLAAHGWLHETKPVTLYHKVHAALISRNVAEHLSLSESDLLNLMQRSADWFSNQNLPTPSLYVPPAWAMGSIRYGTLRSLPFSFVESTRGFLSVESGRYRWLPLVGYEADTEMRARCLRMWNASQVMLSRCTGRCLRLSIHPFDPELKLAKDLDRILSRNWTFIQHPAEA